ncbi:exopolysaccharide biosynthesis protein [Coxiella-like endosymbiont]
MLLLPISFSNFIFAILIIPFSLSLIERDGGEFLLLFGYNWSYSYLYKFC